MKYRSRTQISAQILEAAIGGATKSKIMYKSFLSYVQLNGYLPVLLANDLIRLDEKEKMYKTTERGNRFLKIYHQMGEVIPAAESKLNETRKKKSYITL